MDSDIRSNEYIRGNIQRSELYESWDKLAEKRNEFDDYLEELINKYDLEYDVTKNNGYSYYNLKRSEAGS